MKLQIVGIEKYNYTLIDENNNKYKLNIRFYDLPIKIKIGDFIYLTNDILLEVNLFNFGVVERENNLKLISDNNTYYLERYYG